MSLWQRLAEQYPDVTRAAEHLDELIRNVPDLPPPALHESFGLDLRLARVIADPETAPHGVLGVGAWFSDERGLVPAVFVSEGVVAEAETPLSSSALPQLLGTDDRHLLEWAVAIPLPPAELHSAADPLTPAGSEITVGSHLATAGITVTDLTSGTAGFLTAGHAARASGLVARDSTGSTIGRVTRTSAEPPLWQTHPGADVALIQPFTPAQPAAPTPIRASIPPEDVVFRSARGPLPTSLIGAVPSLWFNAAHPPWSQVALTAQAVSRRGDSGGPVYTEDGHVIGHIVGGHPAAYSVIQDIEFQLGAIGARP